MDLMFGASMVLGIGPALALMWIIMRKYTYPAVEQPFFSDATFFLLFFCGLIVGSVLFAAMVMFQLASSMIYMVLLSAIQVMAMVVIMNLKRFRGKSDSVFYGYGLGLGIACGMAMGIAYTITSFFDEMEMDASIVILIVISITLCMMLGAAGTTIGEGIARNRLQEFIFQALLFMVAFNLMFYSVLNTGNEGGFVFYGSCIIMTVLAVGYFYYILHLKLRGVVRDVLKMEGKKRNDIRFGPCRLRSVPRISGSGRASPTHSARHPYPRSP